MSPYDFELIIVALIFVGCISTLFYLALHAVCVGIISLIRMARRALTRAGRAWNARGAPVAEVLDVHEQQLYPDGPNGGRWPDLCTDPPCDPEDMWICDGHLPKGKHHPPALRYGPEPVVAQPAYDDWTAEMEARFRQ